jgi:FAD/FMN-containing dehydrogenase
VEEPAAPALHAAQELPYPMLQTAFDELIPAGLQWYWRGDFFDQIADEAIARHVEFGAAMPTMLSSMHLYPVDGAVHRVGGEETAFSYRDANWSMVIGGIDPEPANAEIISDWAVDYWEALHPYSMGGAYVNFMMEEGEERVRATYRGNYERLARIKSVYDPENVFHVNQNIRPA